MRPLALFVWFALAPVVAQPVAADSACSYDACALRIEPGAFGPRVVRGPIGQEERVSSLTPWGAGLSAAVADTPTASAHAEASRHQFRRGVVLLLASAVAYSVAILPDAPLSDHARLGLGIGGLGLALGGSSSFYSAQRSQSRAVWEYNRTFSR